MRILRYILVAVASLGLVALVPIGSLCFEIDHHGRRDMPPPADAIVVLGASALPDGQPAPDLTIRPRHCAALDGAGVGPRLICTGSVKEEPSSAAASRALAISLGVPPQAIFLADGSANTDEHAQQVETVMAQHDWRTAIVVSHPLHMYRVNPFFERQGISVKASPTPTDMDGFALPWPVYYAMREGAGILWPYLDQAGFPPTRTATLQE